MAVYVWLIGVFVIGAVVGSFINVCVARLPLEKSILWPGSRCGKCLQPVRWYDNVPLVSYWLLRGRCRSCGERFSIQYFLVIGRYSSSVVPTRGTTARNLRTPETHWLLHNP